MPRGIARFLCVICGWGLIGLTAATASAPAGARTTGTFRLGFAPRLPRGSRVLGPANPATKLQITVALVPRDPAALQRFATAVSTPGSPEYGDYITPAQFASRFGPTAAQIQRVESSLRAHGLTPGPITANHLAIKLTASAGALERGLSTTLDRLALPGHLTAIVNRLAPRLDAGIAGLVQSVVGLNGTARLRPLLARRNGVRPSVRAGAVRAHVVTGGPQPCAGATSAASGQSAYTADQLASAYEFSNLYRAGDAGQGQTIALYELESNDPADISAFQGCYGTRASVSYTQVDGGAGGGPGSGEAALDIEAVIGLAPRANIIVYQAPNSNSNGPGAGPYDAFAAIVSEDRAKVVSASWGQCEAVEGASNAAAESTLFEEAAAQGQTVISAAGDSGSEDCYIPSGLPGANTASQLAVDDPASQPFVTGVGGTSMPTLGPRPHEGVWNDGCTLLLGLIGQCGSGAGGGGISSLWRMPSYQSSTPPALGVLQSSAAPCGAGPCRKVPDVSADADPNTGFLIYWNGSNTAGLGQPSGWQSIGGTSLAAPIWAAMIALTNALPQCHGSDIGFANPSLYHVAASAYGADFNDVASGNNDYTGTNGSQYPAAPGYDVASGLGTPNAASLGPALCGSILRLENPGARSSTVKKKVTIRIRTVANATGERFSATGLPAGVTISSATGKISGTPRRIGTSTVTVSARDSAGASATTSFRWTVGGAPTVSRTSLKQGRLELTVSKGRGAPALSRVKLGFPRSFHERAKVIALRNPVASIRVKARAPRHPSASHVSITVTTTDALGNTTHRSVRVRVG